MMTSFSVISGISAAFTNACSRDETFSPVRALMKSGDSPSLASDSLESEPQEWVNLSNASLSFSSLSILLNTTSSFLPWFFSFISPISEADGCSSNSQITIFASSIFWKVRSIPMFSTTSSVLRIPAVSIKRKVIPSMRVVSSITSRVVP